jgi:hypothetical protein
VIGTLGEPRRTVSLYVRHPQHEFMINTVLPAVPA